VLLESRASRFHQIDYQTGKILDTVAKLKGYPSASGASAFDVSTGTYFADMQNLKGIDFLDSMIVRHVSLLTPPPVICLPTGDDILVAIDVNTGKYTDHQLKYSLVDIIIV
jgi:hypothetical protein